MRRTKKIPAGARACLRALLAGQRLGVLATARAGEPYQSLVAFAATTDLRQVLFATARATRKHANLTANPRVALLVTSAGNRPRDFQRAAAVTAVGRAVPVPVRDRKRMRALYLAKHPYLQHFVDAPDCVLFRIRVHSYHLVREFQNVVRLDLPR